MEVERVISKAVEEVKRMLKPYPQLGEDLQKARENLVLTPFDIAILAKMQSEWCGRCGECCRRCTPINISRREAELLAFAVKLPYKKFKRKFKLTPKGDGTFNMSGAPCLFLKGNLCSVYHIRPFVCRAFPVGEAIVEVSEGKHELQLPYYCQAIKKLFAYKMAWLVVKLRVDREDPVLAEQLRRYAENLTPQLKSPKEAMQFALALVEATL